MKRTNWLSYDFGVRGDYEGMYAWLDEHGAKDCEDGLAILSYECKKDLIKEMKADLNESVSIDKRARIYVIHLDTATKKMKGTFLFGGRKAPPWSGYSGGKEEEDIVEV